MSLGQPLLKSDPTLYSWIEIKCIVGSQTTIKLTSGSNHTLRSGFKCFVLSLPRTPKQPSWNPNLQQPKQLGLPIVLFLVVDYSAFWHIARRVLTTSSCSITPSGQSRPRFLLYEVKGLTHSMLSCTMLYTLAGQLCPCLATFAVRICWFCCLVLPGLLHSQFAGFWCVYIYIFKSINLIIFVRSFWCVFGSA